MENNRQKTKRLHNDDIHDRLVSFTVAVVRLARTHQKDRVLEPVFNQIIRSAGSIGANINEARGAVTKAGFARYFHIALQSANETRYWLAVLSKTGLEKEINTRHLDEELTEFIKILTTSLRTMRQKH